MTGKDENAKPESAVETLRRAYNTPGWYVACPAGVDAKEYEAMAADIETHEKMFCYTEMGFFGAKENKPTVDTKYVRTFFIYGRVYKDQPDNEIPEENKYLNVGWMASTLRFASGSETFAFKKIALCTPSELAQDEMRAISEVGSYFTTVGNKNITLGGLVLAGEWIDIIRFRDWQKNDMQKRVVELFVNSPKIPYTDKGISLVQNQMLASLKAGLDAGGIAEEEFDEDGNSIPSYSTSVPRAASVPADQKAQRKLTNCKFKARLAGAIHITDIDGSLTYSY